MLYLEWRGRGDSERLPLLIPRKLFILRPARNDKNGNSAEPRYMAGTRSLPALLFLTMLVFAGVASASTHLDPRLESHQALISKPEK